MQKNFYYCWIRTVNKQSDGSYKKCSILKRKKCSRGYPSCVLVIVYSHECNLQLLFFLFSFPRFFYSTNLTSVLCNMHACTVSSLDKMLGGYVTEVKLIWNLLFMVNELLFILAILFYNLFYMIFLVFKVDTANMNYNSFSVLGSSLMQLEN
jgi:hypothetical protein